MHLKLLVVALPLAAAAVIPRNNISKKQMSTVKDHHPSVVDIKPARQSILDLDSLPENEKLEYCHFIAMRELFGGLGPVQTQADIHILKGEPKKKSKNERQEEYIAQLPYIKGAKEDYEVNMASIDYKVKLNDGPWINKDGTLAEKANIQEHDQELAELKKKCIDVLVKNLPKGGLHWPPSSAPDDKAEAKEGSSSKTDN